MAAIRALSLNSRSAAAAALKEINPFAFLIDREVRGLRSVAKAVWRFIKGSLADLEIKSRRSVIKSSILSSGSRLSILLFDDHGIA